MKKFTKWSIFIVAAFMNPQVYAGGMPPLSEEIDTSSSFTAGVLSKVCTTASPSLLYSSYILTLELKGIETTSVKFINLQQFSYTTFFNDPATSLTTTQTDTKLLDIGNDEGAARVNVFQKITYPTTIVARNERRGITLTVLLDLSKIEKAPIIIE